MRKKIKKNSESKHVLLFDEAQLSERSVVLSDTLRIDSGSKEPPFARSAALLSFSRSPTTDDVPETFQVTSRDTLQSSANRSSASI